MGVQPGDRVANRHGNGLEWCLGFWGTLMAGAVVVPVNTRFSDSEVVLRRHRCRCRRRSATGFRVARRRTVRNPRRRARNPCRPDVHQRHDGIPEGSDGHPRELPVQHRVMRSSPADSPDTADPQPDLGPAVPRHRLQQPAPPDYLPRRHRGDHACVRCTGLSAGDRRRAHQRADLRPRGLLAGDEPAELRRLRHERHRVGHLRRRTDSTRRRRAAAHFVSECAAGQRVRPHRDVVGVDRPAR